MKIGTRKLNVVSLITFIGLTIVLGGSQTLATSVQATYSLTEVNGEKLPAISWITEANGERCEVLTTGGALLLNREGRSGAFAMERIECVAEDGTRSSAVNDFMMFTGTYEISGDQIIIRDEVSTDQGILDGDFLTLTVDGVGIYDGQTTEYIFKIFQ